jgi:hypothetical protein
MQDTNKLRRVLEVSLILFAIAAFHYTFASRNNYWILVFCLLVVIYFGWKKPLPGTLSRKRIWIPLAIFGTLLGRYIADVSTLNQWTIKSDSWGEFRVVSNRTSSLFPIYVTFAGQSHWVWNNFHDIGIRTPNGGIQDIEVKIALFPVQRIVKGKVLSRGDTGKIDNTFAKQGSMFLNNPNITEINAGLVDFGTNSIWVTTNNIVQEINILSGKSKNISFSGPPKFLRLHDFGYIAFIKPNLIVRSNETTISKQTSEIVEGIQGTVPDLLFGNDWWIYIGFTGSWNEYRYWDKIRLNEKILDANSFRYGSGLDVELAFVRLGEINGNLELVWEDEIKNISKVFKPQGTTLNKNTKVHLNKTMLFLTNQDEKGLIVNTIQLDQPEGAVQTTSTRLNGFKLAVT